MLKASWGGGGKGIRKVHSDDEVRQVFKQIQGEVRSVQRHAVAPHCQSGKVLMGACLFSSGSTPKPPAE
jgi:biotin carboxylase